MAYLLSVLAVGAGVLVAVLSTAWTGLAVFLAGMIVSTAVYYDRTPTLRR